MKTPHWSVETLSGACNLCVAIVFIKTEPVWQLFMLDANLLSLYFKHQMISLSIKYSKLMIKLKLLNQKR